jgi:RimJ/RimL family protein N-acetyltransferase
MNWLNPITLKGKHATLVPLSKEHTNDLIEAVNDGELWKLWYAMVPSPENMTNEINRRLDLQSNGLMLPFSVVDNTTQKMIGMTTYSQVDNTNKRFDIGFTWYAKSYQKTFINTECKLLLLTHAFETLKAIAVGFRVDYLNKPSQRAVERLGAKYEGMMRNYALMSDGSIRDMCLYSILPSEWPRIKSHLNHLLDK